jgi:predicted helicase
MVVIGNPPYSGHSANKGAWMSGLMEEYKKSPELKKPAQAKWLSDDYVKFLRFSQWRIEQTGYGVLAFITNHSYLGNPTFLDMRASLMESFDDLYVLDLHGSSKPKEVPPNGEKDQNVFDIQKGVAIALLVKRTSRAESYPRPAIA